MVAPDALRSGVRMRAMAGGARARRIVGAGAELYQLRAYVRGDPSSRIDWKATARTRALVTREYTEDQHLDVLVAIDAGQTQPRAQRRARSLRRVQQPHRTAWPRWLRITTTASGWSCTRTRC